MRNRSAIVHLLAAAATYVALWLLIPKATFLPAIVSAIEAFIPRVGRPAGDYLGLVAFAIVLAPTAAFMAAQIGLVYCFARVRMSFLQAVFALAACVAVAEAVIATIVWQYGGVALVGHYPGVREQLMVAGAYFGPLKIPVTLAIMLAMASIGYLVSLRIKDRNLLLPVVMIAAFIDFLTVSRGPVSLVLKHAPKIAQAVSVPIPQAGTGAFMPIASIGPGDFLFMALVFATVHKLNMRPARNFWFVYAAMTAGMLALVLDLLPMLPALILLAAAVVAANWRMFRLSRQEKVSVAIVGLLLIVLIPIIWTALQPRMEGALKRKPHHPAAAPTGSRR